MLHGNFILFWGEIFIKALEVIGKNIATKKINKITWKNFRSKNDYGKRHKTETSEVAFFLLRPHFNLFSVPYILN